MQNFGKIRTLFNNLFIESFTKEDKVKKEVFRKYLTALKENKILNTQYLVYKNIEDKIEENESRAIEYIKENIKLLEKFKTKDILAENEKLVKLAGKVNTDKIVVSDLHEQITTLIFTKKTPKTINSITESMNRLVDHLKTNQVKEKSPKVGLKHNGILGKLAVEKFNERYADLTETDKKVFKALSCDEEEIKIDALNSVKLECIDLIDTKLTESDIDTKDRLLKVKDKLLRSNYNKESFIDDLNRVAELREDLTI